MSIEIEPKEELELTQDLLSNVPDTYQKNVGYFIWDLMRAVGKVLTTLWNKLAYLTSFFDISKLDYDDLVRFVFERSGIKAKTQTYAGGLLKVTTGAGTILKDTIFETSDGLQFASTSTVTVAQDETFEVRCQSAGEIGNVPANTITHIPATIQGIVSVTNPDPMTGGYEKETKESLLERYFEYLQKSIVSGNKYHYRKWALEVSGVGKAKVKPLWDGDNTVKVIVADANFEPANSTLIQSVQNYIDPYTLEDNVKVGWGCGNGQAPCGAYCTVTGGTALNINVEFDATLKTGVSLQTATANVTAAIKNYLKALVLPDDNDTDTDRYVSYAKMNSAIINADGIKDIENLTINGDTDNIAITETDADCEIAVLGTLTINT